MFLGKLATEVHVHKPAVDEYLAAKEKCIAYPCLCFILAQLYLYDDVHVVLRSG